MIIDPEIVILFFGILVVFQFLLKMDTSRAENTAFSPKFLDFS